MKLIKFAHLIALGTLLGLAASGCRHQPQGTTRIPGAPIGKPQDLTNANPLGTNDLSQAQPTGHPQNDRSRHKDWTKDPTALAANTVHFAFDSSVVRSEEKPNVVAVAEFLKGNPGKDLEVEGHCDERGTEEYNRSLGERRALALREELITLGIDPVRVDTVTYGKDKPVADGHDEAAWKQNRRGVFVVLIPPVKTAAP
jgi:peptidoglycan-associated lipoprotein